MKIVLLENLRKLGAIGDTINVKRGYARNFLIPEKKALFASEKNMGQGVSVSCRFIEKQNCSDEKFKEFLTKKSRI